MHADVIAQKSARFGMVQTLPALSWGAPDYLQLWGDFIQRLVRHHLLFISKWEIQSAHSSIVTCVSAVPTRQKVWRCKTGLLALHTLLFI